MKAQMRFKSGTKSAVESLRSSATATSATATSATATSGTATSANLNRIEGIADNHARDIIERERMSAGRKMWEEVRETVTRI